MTSILLEIAVKAGHSLPEVLAELSSLGITLLPNSAPVQMRGEVPTFVLSVTAPSANIRQTLSELDPILELKGVFSNPQTDVFKS